MISYDTVVQAITQITLRGDRPSIRTIRSELGSGSHSTISGLFKRWRDERVGMEGGPGAPELAALESLAPDLTSRLRAAFQAQVAADLAQLEERRQASDRQVDELGRILAETEAVATQTAAALVERADSEARQIAATTAVANSIQTAVQVLRDDQAATISQVVDAQRSAEQSLQASVAVLVDAVSRVSEQQTHAREQVAADIAASTQILRTALSEMQAHFDERLQDLRRDQEIRLTRLQAAHERDRRHLLRELHLVHTRCGGVGPMPARRMSNR